MVKKNTVPDGWRGIIPVGRRIPRTRFIAFKVPLKGAISQRLTANQKFSPKDLIAKIKEQNEELGLIIDLTYTTRYYTEKDLPKSVQYQKLYTVGHEVPDDATILQFKRRVRKFLWENADNDKIIGVHCTGGINRTGYLICRYLIDVEEVDPETTIELFNTARGHKMDGAVYLADLRCGPMRRPDTRRGPSYGGLPLPARDFDVPPYNRWHDRPRPLPPPLPPPPPSLLYGEHRQLSRFDDYGPEEYIGRSRFNHFNEHRGMRNLEENSRLHSRYAPYSTRLPAPQDRYREDFERKPYSISGRRELESQSTTPNAIFTRDYNHGQPPERGPSLSKLGGGFYDNFDSFRDYEWN
ncbi:RNA/RNP complex-1-interacting phosphatase-like isoform X2 [Mobula birostris]|uniref:RNA/RNP complex-1-interacting phosphatase-like isoform X2 n=1 Tax=Mobula birostris TaxID=1983395 RepID=UPI003B27BC27